jgi:hypothetical protein
MCIAEWSWGSKSKSFVCSSLKPASKSRQDEMRYTFDIAKCDRILTTCCRKSKLNYQVATSYRRWNISKSIRIVNGIISILMLLTIAMLSVNRFNRP